MAGGIFVSYRRDDAKHAAGRLVDRLGHTFSRDQLFLDIDNIDPGLDFVKVLSEKVHACDVLLAVIGPNWSDSRDERGSRRLENPKDFVRIEIEAALRRDIRVIPVLVDGARMPGEIDLPQSLRPLANRNAVRLAHERFSSDAADLTRALTKIVAPARKGWFRSVASAPQAVPIVRTTTTPSVSEKKKRARRPFVAGFAPTVVAVLVSMIALGANFLAGALFVRMNWTWFGERPILTGGLAGGLATLTIMSAIQQYRWTQASTTEMFIYLAAGSMTAGWSLFVAILAITHGEVNGGWVGFGLSITGSLLIFGLLLARWRNSRAGRRMETPPN